MSEKTYIFNEVVEFEFFSCSYDEEFEIKKDEDLIIKMESDINKGDISLKIYNDNGSVIYEKTGGHLNESDRVNITKGTWHYAFSCCNGEKNFDAENGSYSVRIQEERLITNKICMIIKHFKVINLNRLFKLFKL